MSVVAAVKPGVLSEVFRTARLTARERQVIRDRLAGKSFARVAGGRCRRQRVQRIERRALGKLGLAGSLAAVVHTDERAGRAEFYRERGRAVRLAELQADPTEVGPSRPWRPEPWELAHERAVAEFLATCG
jgi:hypothetical protein